MTSQPSDSEIAKVQLERELVVGWLGLFRALRLYDWRHSGVEAAADRVRAMTRQLAADGSNVDVVVREDSIYIERARVRETGSVSLSFHKFIRLLRAAGVSSFCIDPDGQVENIQLFG